MTNRDATECSGVNTGANQTSGGSSVAKNQYVGGEITTPSDINILADNKNLELGAAGDAILYYDGTNMVINPKSVGSGYVDVAGSVNIATGEGFKVNGTQVVTDQGAALTAQDTSITHTAPGTPDFAIQDLTNSSPFGFVTQDEGNTVLQVILNLQTRVAELESRLQAHGLIA